MGCWENGEGGVCCDGPADYIDEWLDEKFGKKYPGKDLSEAPQNREILKTILENEKMFMGLYNKVKKDFVYLIDPETGKFGNKQREMTIREFICHLNFCLRSQGEIQTPGYALALSRKQGENQSAPAPFAFNRKGSGNGSNNDDGRAPSKVALGFNPLTDSVLFRGRK